MFSTIVLTDIQIHYFLNCCTFAVWISLVLFVFNYAEISFHRKWRCGSDHLLTTTSNTVSVRILQLILVFSRAYLILSDFLSGVYKSLHVRSFYTNFLQRSCLDAQHCCLRLFSSPLLKQMRPVSLLIVQMLHHFQKYQTGITHRCYWYVVRSRSTSVA